MSLASDAAAEARANRAEAEFNAAQHRAEQGEAPAPLQFHDALTAASHIKELAGPHGLSTGAEAVQLSIAEAADRGESGFAALEQAIDQLEHLQRAAASQGVPAELTAGLDRLWNCLYQEKAVRLPEHTIAESVQAAQASTGQTSPTEAVPGGVVSASHQLESAQNAAIIAAAASELSSDAAATSSALEAARQVWGEASLIPGANTELNYFDTEVQAAIRREVSEALAAKLATLSGEHQAADMGADLFTDPVLDKIAKLMSTQGQPVTREQVAQASLETIAQATGLALPDGYQARVLRNDTTDGLARAA